MFSGIDPGGSKRPRYLRDSPWGRPGRAGALPAGPVSAGNLIGGDATFERIVAKVVGFVEAPSLGLNLPLDVRGTAFQQRVWQSLRKIPAGSTASYTDIAKLIGSPKSVRAVAQACGANTLAVAIPCHRVVRNDGALSGYRWGVERKRALLEKEAHK